MFPGCTKYLFYWETINYSFWKRSGNYKHLSIRFICIGAPRFNTNILILSKICKEYSKYYSWITFIKLLLNRYYAVSMSLFPRDVSIFFYRSFCGCHSMWYPVVECVCVKTNNTFLANSLSFSRLKMTWLNFCWIRTRIIKTLLEKPRLPRPVLEVAAHVFSSGGACCMGLLPCLKSRNEWITYDSPLVSTWLHPFSFFLLIFSAVVWFSSLLPDTVWHNTVASKVSRDFMSLYLGGQCEIF